MNWTSVKDELPQPNKTVLVCNAKKYNGKAWLSHINDSMEWPVAYVTHWTPLPEPPEVTE